MIFLFLILLKPALRAVETDYAKFTLKDWADYVINFDWPDCLALLIAGPLDVFIAHTTWALVFGWPKRGEWTVSHTLERIVSEHKHPRWLLAAAIAQEINETSPTGKHIKAIAL